MSDGIGAMVADALQKAIAAQSQYIMEQTRQMMPTLRGDFSSFFVEYGDDLSNTIDSTAIVIDDSVKALPSPMESELNNE